MSSRNLLNLVLLIVIAALMAVVVYEPGKQATPVVKLTALSKSAVHRIEISRIGVKKIVLEKNGGKWRMLEPYAMPADAFKADSISELAEAKSTAQYPVNKGENLKPFSLDVPRLTVVFNGKVKLEFGGSDPLKFQRYIRVGDTLHLIFDRYYYNLSAAAPEFVDHALLPDQPTITRLVLPKFSLTRQGDKWQAQPPVNQLSNDQVNELLDNWTGAHATDMLDYTPATAPDKAPEQAQLYLKGRDKPLVFDVLHEKDAVSLGRADLGIKYKFTEDIGNSLLNLPEKIKAEPPKTDAGPTAGKPQVRKQ